MNILQMGFSASILILAVILIRGFAINRLPKKTFLALWTVVVVRALIPFSISSPFSVYSFIDIASLMTGKMAENPLIQVFLMAFPTQILPENIEIVQQIQPTSESIKLIANTEALSLLIFIWVVGTVLCILYFLTAYARFYTKFKTSTVVRSDFVTTWIGEHRIIRPISVKQSKRISTPLTYGFFYPVILMPEKMDWSNEKELGYVLMHEYIHIRRFDTVVKLFLTAALCLYWFNPLVWAMYILANRDLEIACDEEVLQSFGETVKSSYALTLLRLEEGKIGFTPYYSSFSKNAAEERIKAIMIYKKSSAVAIVTAVILVIGTTLAFAFSASTATKLTSGLPEPKDNVYAVEEGSNKNSISSVVIINNSESVDSEIIKINTPISVSVANATSNTTTDYETVYVSLSTDGNQIDLQKYDWDVLEDGAVIYSVNEPDGRVTDYKIYISFDEFYYNLTYDPPKVFKEDEGIR